ncbi:MAG: MBL fold metallo-hydrolase [Alphaproteobacteria bacterium]
MYRVGFGDCFLLTLPRDAAGDAHILIDCGVHSQGDIGIMSTIVADVAKECGGHLALIIATHAHQDHISAFGKFADQFKKLTVDQVWLPWTEDSDDPTARGVKQKHLALAQALAGHFAALGVTGDSARGLAREALYAVANASGNEAALALLKSGVNGGKVSYFKAGVSVDDAAGIAGLSVRVLGPPTDQKFLAVMNPPTNDRFLRLGDDGQPVVANGIQPIEDKWVVKEGADPAYPILSDADKAALRALADSSTALAFSLDSVLNNTSVVTLFSYRGKTLLFPGDAQYGNWQSWITTPDGEAILEHVDFLKVAHHGSLNATPKSALEKMPDKKFAAMISTQSKPWPSIPFPKMLAVLHEKATGVVQSDSIEVAGAKNAPKGPPLSPEPGFSIGPFWCDYALAL